MIKLSFLEFKFSFTHFILKVFIYLRGFKPKRQIHVILCLLEGFKVNLILPAYGVVYYMSLSLCFFLKSFLEISKKGNI